MQTFDSTKPESMEPIPIKELGDPIVFVDGHTRAFAAFLHNISEIPIYWEDEELDWDAYKICVVWHRKDGIHTIADLQNRVVSQKDYETLWHRRCEEMQQDLAKKRRKKNTSTRDDSGVVPPLKNPR
jgi:hypothetical protein